MGVLRAQRGAPWAGGPPGRSGAVVAKAEWAVSQGKRWTGERRAED